MGYTIDPTVRAALFDIDGTLTLGGDVWSTLIHSSDVRKFKRGWLYVTAMPHYVLSKTGVVSQAKFRSRWVRLMAWLMTGWSAEQTQEMYDRIVAESLVPVLRPDVVNILEQHQAQDHPVVLVSTMFDGIVNGLAHYLGAETGLGSEMAFREGQCEGRIMGSTCAGKNKIAFARQYLVDKFPELSLDVCAAYADSQSDISFLSGVGFPVAVYPDQMMQKAAEERGWHVYAGDT